MTSITLLEQSEQTEMIAFPFKYKVDRTKTPLEMIKALRRTEQITDGILPTMPIDVDGPTTGELYFFPAEPKIRIAEQFEVRNLVPDVYAQLQVNANHPALGDNYRNYAEWEVGGQVYAVALYDWRGRVVCVHKSVGISTSGWWLAGRPQ